MRPARAPALAEAIVALASSPLLGRRLALGGLAAARERSWEAALEQLACGYDEVLGRVRVAPAPAPEPIEPAPLVHAA